MKITGRIVLFSKYNFLLSLALEHSWSGEKWRGNSRLYGNKKNPSSEIHYLSRAAETIQTQNVSDCDPRKNKNNKKRIKSLQLGQRNCECKCLVAAQGSSALSSFRHLGNSSPYTRSYKQRFQTHFQHYDVRRALWKIAHRVYKHFIYTQAYAFAL